MVISGGRIIEGAYGSPYLNAGVPSAGTSEVQTLTIGGTPTGGTFKLVFEGIPSAAITWSATNGTLLSNINTALDLHPSLGTAGCVASDSTLTAGIGDLLLTFGAARAQQAVSTMTAVSSLTGTTPTLAIAETTPGVNATALGIPAGAIVIDSTNKKIYCNTGTALAPAFTVVGSQS